MTMQEATLTSQEVAQLIDSLARHQVYGWRNQLTFQNRANRDLVARTAKQRGIRTHKSSIRNQLLDPRYTVEGCNLPDKGLANDYKHHFSVLYHLERG